MIAIVNLAGEGNPLAVGRPTRLIIGFVVIGNFCELATFGADYPYISVAVLVVFFSGTIRNKRDPSSIRRPLRIAIVPVVALGNLFRVSGLNIDNPKMRAAIVEPTGVVEFVRSVLVVADVAVIATVRAVVAGTCATDNNETRSIRRPTK